MAENSWYEEITSLSPYVYHVCIAKVIVCLSMCYVRDPWLNKLMFSKNNITTN